MKNLLLFILFFIAVSASAQPAADIEKIKNLMKEEPKVKDHVYTPVLVLYVAVIDDGTKRNGYAEYICQVLREAHIKAYKVKVVKFGSQKDPKRDNAYGVLLGEAQCN